MKDEKMKIYLPTGFQLFKMGCLYFYRASFLKLWASPVVSLTCTVGKLKELLLEHKFFDLMFMSKIQSGVY
jgi:hypothetical protein